MELKDLLLAVLLQKKYFKYRKNKMMSRTHDREGNWNCLNLFLPLFLMPLKFNIAALLVPLLWVLHNPIIINLSAAELELDYTLFSSAETSKCCQRWKRVAVPLFRESRAGKFIGTGTSTGSCQSRAQLHWTHKPSEHGGWGTQRCSSLELLDASWCPQYLCVKHKVQSESLQL